MAKHLTAFRDWMIETINRLYIHYCVSISSRAKCVGCGIRAEHEMRWSATYQHVMHRCARCQAIWGDPPIVQVSAWNVKEADEQVNLFAETKDGTTVSRAPTIIKSPGAQRIGSAS